jgi:N-acetylneuraminic acid mutarotase
MSGHLEVHRALRAAVCVLSIFVAGCGGSSTSGCFFGVGPDCPPPPPPPAPAPPDTTPPSVLLVYPEASATYVPRDTFLNVVFDRSLDPSSVTTANFVVRDAAYQPMSGDVSYSSLWTCFTGPLCGYQVSFKPQGAFAFGAQYTATVTGVRNASGLPMASDYTWSFTVIPAGAGTWQPTTTIGAPIARVEHTAVWTGTRMIVWGGRDDRIPPLVETATGGLYDPTTDTWQATSLVNAPSPLLLHTAVWTGSEMIVWGWSAGSNQATGGRYAPASDSWRNVSASNAPATTSGHTAVWTGARMIVWGGSSVSNAGGIYDPIADIWQATSLVNAPSPRSLHAAVWTGSEMIVWGGIVRSGDGTLVLSNSGGRYSPVTDTWIPMSTLGAPEPRESPKAVWTGSRMVVWGGFNKDSNGNLNFPASSGIYDPATDTWQTMPLANAPPGRVDHTAVWTGSEMIVWGGVGAGTTYFNNGARYNPATSAWTTTSNTNVPSSREDHSAVWTGAEMIIWGGHPATETGGRYTP